MPSPTDYVYEFHEVYGHPISDIPKLQDDNYLKFRERLIDEEFTELKLAIQEHNLVGIADALGDLIYVIYGFAISCGIPLDECVEEIHRSNMTKLGTDGKPIRRADGKILKGPNYEPPNLAAILDWHIKSAQFSKERGIQGSLPLDTPSEATERDSQTP